MDRVCIVDDDPTYRTILRAFLGSSEFEVTEFEDAHTLLETVSGEQFDLLVSDLRMPGIDGAELFTRIRQTKPDLPVIFVTSESDIGVAVHLMQDGACDYIVKPGTADDILFRVRKSLRSAKAEAALKKAEYEKTLLELENRQLLSWRAMYATKDIKQTEQLINQISRTVNASGGFMWIDLLKSLATRSDDHYTIPADLYELIIDSSLGLKHVFDFLTYLSQIDYIHLETTRRPARLFLEECYCILNLELAERAKTHNRAVTIDPYPQGLSAFLNIEMESFKKILKELSINAIKYSPEGSRIVVNFETEDQDGVFTLRIIVRNKPRELDARDEKGARISGIPVEYSERVFDLFYTIDAHPNSFADEDWSDGTGLYIARKLLKRQNAWLKTNNGVDYSGPKPEPFVRFVVIIPLLKQ